MDSIGKHRLLVYFILSFLAVALAIGNALRNHSNFFSVAIYLSQSSRSLLIFANFGMIIALFAGRAVQAVFFGELRANEIERLQDRAWYFVTESLLAFTIFRDEFDVGFVLMFGFLLFVKSFHWLAADRIEWMDQRPYPGPPLNFHVRMITLFLILWILDSVMFMIAVESTLEHGVGGMVLFASEYSILTASIWNTIAKYLLIAYDLRRAGQRGGETAPPWENKSMWVFYVELITDFLKLTTYMAFFLIIMMFYGLPINIIRDCFYTRLVALHRYQAATKNMDQRYPTATAEEMAALSDHTCIICREEMTLGTPTEGEGQLVQERRDGPNMTPKKLPCGHIFHFFCLKSWLERQQSCPTCRRSVLETATPAGNTPGQQAAPAANGAQPPAAEPNDRRPPPMGGFLHQFMPGNPAQNNNNAPINRAPIGTLPPPPPRGLPPPVVLRQPGGGLLVQYHIPPGGLPAGLRTPGQIPPAPAPGQAPVSPTVPAVTPAPTINHPPPPADTRTLPLPSAPTRTSGSSSETSQTPALSTSSVPTPREAAAQAALRRFGVPTPPTTNEPSGSSEQTTTSESTAEMTSIVQDQATSEISIESPVLPTHTAMNVDPSPTTTTPQPAPSEALNPNEWDDVPRLIPVYDWARTYPGTQGASAALASLRSIPLLRNLPPRISTSQLQALDRLTREAIDERLRVLESVNGTIGRCVDELMQLRSMLPLEDGEETSSEIDWEDVQERQRRVGSVEVED
ncbi:hypothetical protein DL96DRAFT_1601806 [Flagelloscypha sp. PMI_526]|nr:hypothetical protein DL96DRAFT_1601806 [Flagelloscypha sp. PMI_526]